MAPIGNVQGKRASQVAEREAAEAAVVEVAAVGVAQESLCHSLTQFKEIQLSSSRRHRSSAFKAPCSHLPPIRTFHLSSKIRLLHMDPSRFHHQHSPSPPFATAAVYRLGSTNQNARRAERQYISSVSNRLGIVASARDSSSR